MRLLYFFPFLSLSLLAQDPDAIDDPTRGLSAQEARPFSRERKMKDIEREQLAKYISISGKLIPRQSVEALYAKCRETYVFNKDYGMLKPMHLDEFLIMKTGGTSAVLERARQGAKKASYKDPYSGMTKTINLPGKKMVVNDVIELEGKLVRRFGPREVVIETAGKYMGIVSQNSIVEDKQGMVSLRVFKMVKAETTRKVRFGTENVSVPMYKDMTLTAEDFAFWARREFPFKGLDQMLKNDAVSPDVAQRLSRPSLKSSQSLNPKP